MATETLRPNDDGDYTNIKLATGGGEHWINVDEDDPDEHITVNYTDEQVQEKDAYELEDGSIPSGSTINSVKVYFRCRANATDIVYFQPFLRLSTNETTGTEIDQSTDTWTTYSEILARPGGGAWATDDIPSLQVVIGLKTGATYALSQCTQVYVEVDYTPPAAKPPTFRLDPKPRTRARFYPNLKLG